MSGNVINYEQRINAKALAIALAIYQPSELGTDDHADRVYYAVDAADFGSDGRKADLYAQLAERLTPGMRLDMAEAIIAECMKQTNKRYLHG